MSKKVKLSFAIASIISTIPGGAAIARHTGLKERFLVEQHVQPVTGAQGCTVTNKGTVGTAQNASTKNCDAVAPSPTKLPGTNSNGAGTPAAGKPH